LLCSKTKAPMSPARVVMLWLHPKLNQQF
jgi:hypothetical protein